MPIRYRCPACEQLLSIATRMVGQVVNCPTCGTETVVPPQDEPGAIPSPPPVVAAAEIEDGPPVLEPVVEMRPARAVAIEPADHGGFVLRARHTDDEEMDLTPMVDMTFLLLIFFMITASFSVQKTIEVPAPNAEQKGAAQALSALDELESNSVSVRVDERNAIFVEDQPIADRSQLTDALRRAMRSTQKRDLILTAADAAFHETVVAVIDAANEAGMQKIRMATHAAELN